MSSSPTAILTSDLHIRLDNPACRLDKFHETVKRKLDWLADLAYSTDCPILDAGDFFNKFNPSVETLITALDFLGKLPMGFYTVPGNHDLPRHNLQQLYQKSALYLLERAATMTVFVNPQDPLEMLLGPNDERFSVSGCPWGLEPVKIKKCKTPRILLAHRLVWKDGGPPWLGADQEGERASEFMARPELAGYDLVVTGHFHKSFQYKTDDGRLLVNPGGIFRQTASEADRNPQVYLWFAENNTARPLEVPIEEGVVSSSHIIRAEERFRDSAAGARFIQAVKEGNMKKELQFDRVLSAIMERQKTEKWIRDMVMDILQEAQ